ncbi:MAG: Gfo/Idh/MocA family oxidoreductase [Spirochaetia bacterium]|nr:Gfo/Idh/MocA family oxidoreductase [Spirochaetia bacterium]MBR5017892.1 Gfo/Idh/MocA family oxidoreductase [Spirochaetia bacterium]
MKKVITYGSFDLFHQGHYNLLKNAKALGDYLIVGVTTEAYDETRGKLNIVDSLEERMSNVRKTGFADMIIAEDHLGQKVEDIQRYGVDIFAIGSDWVGYFDYLKDLCEVVYLPRTKDVSSTELRLKNHAIIRIGIMGTGRIASRFVPEAKYVSGVTIKGVFNPHKESAEKFKTQFDLAFCTDDIEKFFELVDAVYIASPHATHYGYAKAALEHGKHVLCEKPMAFKKAEAEELFAIAKEKKRILLEAIKTAYCPGFNQLLGVARSGVIGNIRDVEASFTRLTRDGWREKTDTEYGGGFTEYGSHTLLPIIKLLGKDYEDVRFESILAENGIDLYTKAYFKYKNALALSKSGVGVKSEGQLIIAGTKGYILVPSPWWLTQYFEVRYEDPNKVDRYTVKFLGQGLRYEISDFAHLINGKEDRFYKFTKGESIAMAGVMEKFMEERYRQRASHEK